MINVALLLLLTVSSSLSNYPHPYPLRARPPLPRPLRGLSSSTSLALFTASFFFVDHRSFTFNPEQYEQSLWELISYHSPKCDVILQIYAHKKKKSSSLSLYIYIKIYIPGKCRPLLSMLSSAWSSSRACWIAPPIRRSFNITILETMPCVPARAVLPATQKVN